MAVADYLYVGIDGQPMMREPTNDEEEYYFYITILLDKEHGTRLWAYRNYRKAILDEV